MTIKQKGSKKKRERSYPCHDPPQRWTLTITPASISPLGEGSQREGVKKKGKGGNTFMGLNWRQTHKPFRTPHYMKKKLNIKKMKRLQRGKMCGRLGKVEKTHNRHVQLTH